jgi:hypothetical protein
MYVEIKRAALRVEESTEQTDKDLTNLKNTVSETGHNT